MAASTSTNRSSWADNYVGGVLLTSTMKYGPVTIDSGREITALWAPPLGNYIADSGRLNEDVSKAENLVKVYTCSGFKPSGRKKIWNFRPMTPADLESVRNTGTEPTAMLHVEAKSGPGRNTAQHWVIVPTALKERFRSSMLGRGQPVGKIVVSIAGQNQPSTRPKSEIGAARRFIFGHLGLGRRGS